MPEVDSISIPAPMKPVDKRPNDSNSVCGAYRNKKIVVTGGAGYLATNLVRRLGNTECEIIRMGRDGSVFPEFKGKARVTNVSGDVRERVAWEKVLPEVNFIFHFAAQTSVLVAERDPRADLEANVVPVLNLIEACRKKGCQPTVLFSSTATVAGIPSRLPVDETHPDLPVTVYDMHKLIVEHYLKCFAREGAIRTAILRLANVYGPGPKSSRSDRGILNQMMRKALAGEALTIYGPGEFLRDYVYVDDVIEAFLRAGRDIKRTNLHHFIIGSGQGYTIAQAIQLVSERAGKQIGRKVEVKHVQPPAELSPIESRNFVADPSLFSGTTGWKPSVSLPEGIDLTLKALA